MFCVALWSFELNYIDPQTTCTVTCIIREGDPFILLSQSEVIEAGIIECEVLFENKRMWFNIGRNSSMMVNVRGAESYDIPFMAITEAEPGSNSPPQPVYPQHPRLRAFSHTFTGS